MPTPRRDTERLLAIEGVHTVSAHPDEGTVLLGVAERDPTLPRTARIDGDELRVVQEARPKPESLGRILSRARAADRAASAGYHPAVPADWLREYEGKFDAPTRPDGGEATGVERTGSDTDTDAEADARTGPRDEKQRPLAGGLQVVGGSGSGTIGPPARVADVSRASAEWADDVSEGDIVLCTNRHVLPGDLGDPVYQPSPAQSDYRIGEIGGYVPLEDGTHADIAAIKLDPEEAITDYAYWELDSPDESVQRSGYFDAIGNSVTHSGATSGVATGTLQDIEVAVPIDYGGSIGTVTVHGTNEATDISQGGDSGAQKFNDSDSAMLSLNFASDSGFQEGGDHSWGIRMDYAEQELGVRFLTAADVRDLTGEEGGTGVGYVARNGAYTASGGSYAGPGTTDPTDPPEEPGDPPSGPPPGGDGTGIGNPPFGFTRTVDAVDDLGMDPTGTDPCDGQMDKRDGTLIEFPPGDYLFAEGFNARNDTAFVGVNSWGMVGTGATRDDVRIHTTEGEGRRLFNWGNACSNIYLANLTFDQSDSLATAIRLLFAGDGGFYTYNTQFVGQQPNENQLGPPDGDDPNAVKTSLMVHCEAPDRVAEVIDFKHTVEEDVIDYPHNWSAMGSYRGNRGTVYLRNAWIANKGEHAWYASRCAGQARIDGGLYENCANTNMRICGEGSWAQDATVRVDRDSSYFALPDGSTKAARGLRWESGGSEGGVEFAQSGGSVENCDFIYETEMTTPGLVEIEGNAGAMDMTDCRFYSDNNSGPVVRVIAIGDGPNGYIPPQPHTPVRFEGCSFTGSTNSAPISSSRDGTEADECCNGLSSPYQGVTVTDAADPPCSDPTQ